MAEKFPTQIKLTIQNADEVLFSGDVYAVTSVNHKGEFDILPGHTNFITLISEILLIHVTKTEKKEFPLDTGLLKVANNEVEVYLGIDSIKQNF